MTPEQEVQACIDTLLLQLQKESGIRIEIIKDPNFMFPAALELAGESLRDHHVLRVNTTQGHVEHMILTMLVRRQMYLKANKEGRSLIFLANKGEHLDFISHLKTDPGYSEFVTLEGKKRTRVFLEGLTDDFLRQNFNQLHEMSINEVLLKKYPCDKPLFKEWVIEYCRVMAKAQEEQARNYVEFFFLHHIERMVFLVYAMHGQKLCGADAVRFFHPEPEEMDEALDLFSFFLKSAKEYKKPGDAYRRVYALLSKLGMEKFCHLQAESAPLQYDRKTIQEILSAKETCTIDTDRIPVVDAPVMANLMYEALERLTPLSMRVLSRIMLESSSFYVSPRLLDVACYELPSLPKAGFLTGKQALAYRGVCMDLVTQGEKNTPYIKALRSAKLKFRLKYPSFAIRI